MNTKEPASNNNLCHKACFNLSHWHEWICQVRKFLSAPHWKIHQASSDHDDSKHWRTFCRFENNFATVFLLVYYLFFLIKGLYFVLFSSKYIGLPLFSTHYCEGKNFQLQRLAEQCLLFLVKQKPDGTESHEQRFLPFY